MLQGSVTRCQLAGGTSLYQTPPLHSSAQCLSTRLVSCSKRVEVLAARLDPWLYTLRWEHLPVSKTTSALGSMILVSCCKRDEEIAARLCDNKPAG